MSHQIAARIVDEAGGELVGRTRLQKVACLAWLAGYLDSFSFEYRHYGPFSESLAGSMEVAAALNLVVENERKADWGGWYSVYTSTSNTPVSDNADRKVFIKEAAKIGPILLELVATAAYLHAIEGFQCEDAWLETKRRKPEKANGRLDAAKQAFCVLRKLPTPKPLPDCC